MQTNMCKIPSAGTINKLGPVTGWRNIGHTQEKTVLVQTMPFTMSSLMGRDMFPKTAPSPRGIQDPNLMHGSLSPSKPTRYTFVVIT